ncbi:hypothetical protein EVAR_37833_1 [Eumeta japonica]|uniref:Uncharacterized protein n=1 Tax=Eumeta variegata TaxID=151549 RepID=A0A4C1X475_EUMVA|nr:hypothetical protein EVAR_37833_1 [Eumeta japonica]
MNLWGDGPFLFYTRGNNVKKRNYYSKKRRLEKAKLKRQEKIANESDVHRRQRLEKIRVRTRTFPNDDNALITPPPPPQHTNTVFNEHVSKPTFQACCLEFVLQALR